MLWEEKNWILNTRFRKNSDICIIALRLVRWVNDPTMAMNADYIARANIYLEFLIILGHLGFLKGP